jgi:hypothetical protein
MARAAIEAHRRESPKGLTPPDPSCLALGERAFHACARFQGLRQSGFSFC